MGVEKVTGVDVAVAGNQTIVGEGSGASIVVVGSMLEMSAALAHATRHVTSSKEAISFVFEWDKSILF